MTDQLNPLTQSAQLALSPLSSIPLTSSVSSSSQSSTKPQATLPFNRILTPISHANLSFLILDCPTSQTLPLYLVELLNRNVTHVIRVCEPTYDKRVLESSGIVVCDWPFKDGGIPSNEIILGFLGLCDEVFGGLVASSTSSQIPIPHSSKPPPCVVRQLFKSLIFKAVHCVAGLGRAPILVAIALIESGMTPIDTVEFVRQRRRGALNTVQLQFLMDVYKKQWGKRRKGEAGNVFSRFFGRKD